MGPSRSGKEEVRVSWDDPENARRYAEFTRHYPMYRDTSRDLVAAAQISPGATVLDLCCGTGATTATLLEAVGPAGRVIGLDASEAMLAEASRQLKDKRVEFACAPAEELTSAVPRPVDAVVCNSAIWQTDMPTVFDGIAEVLRPGGRFACNIGRPFTAEELDDRRPGLIELAYAIAVLEHDFVPTGGRRPDPGTPQSVTDLLTAAGLTPAEPQVVEYLVPPEQTQAWLSIPIFSQQTPGRTYSEKMEILDAAFERLGHRAPQRRRWVIFTATK